MLLRYKPKGLVYISTNSTIGIATLKNNGMFCILLFRLRIKGADMLPCCIIRSFAVLFQPFGIFFRPFDIVISVIGLRIPALLRRVSRLPAKGNGWQTLYLRLSLCLSCSSPLPDGKCWQRNCNLRCKIPYIPN